MFRSISKRIEARNSKREGKRGEGKKGKRSEMDEMGTVQPDSSRIGTSLFQPKVAGNLETSQDMDRTLYEMPMPDNVDAMTDLIKLHKPGDKFPYVGIVGQDGETVDARRSRMLALKPSYGLRNVPEIEVSGCELIDSEGEFNMTSLMEFAKKSIDPVQPQSSLRPKTSSSTRDYSIKKKYVHIRSITGLYTPNMSSTADFCKLWFQLVDNRLINSSKSGQSNALVSNQEGVMEMSCDYCVNVRDLDHFILCYTLEREIVKPGFQWGTISFYFNITESDIPFQTVKKDAIAVYRMPLSTLASREVSADKSDISFTPMDLISMRKMYLSGDIVDVDEPQQARLKKSSYSKSTLRGAQKGEDLEESIATRPGWEHMKGGKKPMIDAELASVDVEDEGSEDDGRLSRDQLMAKSSWEKEQERMRGLFSETSILPGKSILKGDDSKSTGKELVTKSSLDNLFSKSKGLKRVGFPEDNV